MFLFDEIDNAHPSILTLLNSSLANGHGEFPDGRIERNANTRFIASANTIGKGATGEYVGRAPIDAATTDRFAYIPFDTDPSLEEALILGLNIERDPLAIDTGDVPNDREWLAIVRANRIAVAELGIRALISQRAALYGKRLAAQGVGKDWLHEMLIYKGMKPLDREKLEAKAKKLVRNITDSKGDRLVTQELLDQFTEPSPDVTINEALGSVNYISDAIYNNFGYDQDHELLNNTSFVALCWQLEKYIENIDICESRHKIRGYYNDLYDIDQKSSVKKFGKTLASKGSSAFYRYTKGPLDSAFQSTLAGILDNEAIDANKVVNQANEFQNIFEFIPGPVSLAFWLKQTGRETQIAKA